MHPKKKFIIIAAGLVAVYALAGFFLLPAILGPRIRESVSEQTNCPVSMGELKVNPFALSATVRDFTLMDRDSVPMVSFRELYVNIAMARGGFQDGKEKGTLGMYAGR